MHLVIPELDELLDEAPVEFIPFSKTFEECRMEPWLRLHTSGSTGTPKVITLKQGLPTITDAFQALPPVNELAQRCGQKRFFSPFPYFHIAGLNFTLIYTIWCDSTAVFSLANLPVSADNVNAIQLRTGIEYAVLPPSVVGDIAKNEKYLNDL